MRARRVRVAPDREPAEERSDLVLCDEDRRMRVPPQRLEVAALVARAAPFARDADQPALRFGADRGGESCQLLGVGGVRVPDPVVHPSTTTAPPPRRGSPAAASAPSSPASTAETPPKNRFFARQRTTR